MLRTAFLIMACSLFLIESGMEGENFTCFLLIVGNRGSNWGKAWHKLVVQKLFIMGLNSCRLSWVYLADGFPMAYLIIIASLLLAILILVILGLLIFRKRRSEGKKNKSLDHVTEVTNNLIAASNMSTYGLKEAPVKEVRSEASHVQFESPQFFDLTNLGNFRSCNPSATTVIVTWMRILLSIIILTTIIMVPLPSTAAPASTVTAGAMPMASVVA